MSSRKDVYIPPGGPPQNRPNPEIYAKMGEQNIFQMLKDFYLLLGQSKIKNLFPKNMEEASKKSAMFFVFLLGGPPLYQEKYGAPMMRQRHMPFAIDESARQVWLECFKSVLENGESKYNFPKEHLVEFIDFLEKFSAWMVNTKES